MNDNKAQMSDSERVERAEAFEAKYYADSEVFYTNILVEFAASEIVIAEQAWRAKVAAELEELDHSNSVLGGSTRCEICKYIIKLRNPTDDRAAN